MKYSKGDTFKTKDGLIGLVLNNGLTGVEFYDKYNGIRIPYIDTTGVEWDIVGVGWKYTIERYEGTHRRQEITVYYSVLLGDMRGWMELDDLERGNTKVLIENNAV